MSEDKTYNGWKNWETWHTALLIDNEELMYNHAWALAKRCAAIKLGRVKNKTYDHSRAVNAFKKQFAGAWRQTRDFARESWPHESIDDPDWNEIARHFIDEAIYELSGEYPDSY